MYVRIYETAFVYGMYIKQNIYSCVIVKHFNILNCAQGQTQRCETCFRNML